MGKRKKMVPWREAARLNYLARMQFHQAMDRDRSDSPPWGAPGVVADRARETEGSMEQASTTRLRESEPQVNRGE